MRLVDAVEGALVGADAAALEQELFGTTDPAGVASAVVATAAAVLGEPVDGGFFYGSSVSAVAGLELAGGRRVLVRLARPEWIGDRAGAVLALQRRLSSAGFPCAEPVAGPVETGGAVVTVESWLDGGPPDPPASVPAREALVHGLVELARLAGPVEEHERLARPTPESIYPPPHDLRFDFEATAHGAAWIDEVAAAARVTLDSTELPRVVGHADWRGGNVVTRGGRVTAAYDWDSATTAPESQIVGGNAHAWSIAWEWGHHRLPSVEQSDRFVAAYERARGRAFEGEERRVLDAAHAYSLAYISRCQHSDEQLGLLRRDPDRASERLRLVAERL